jgi:hypothetical protein
MPLSPSAPYAVLLLASCLAFLQPPEPFIFPIYASLSSSPAPEHVTVIISPFVYTLAAASLGLVLISIWTPKWKAVARTTVVLSYVSSTVGAMIMLIVLARATATEHVTMPGTATSIWHPTTDNNLRWETTPPPLYANGTSANEDVLTAAGGHHSWTRTDAALAAASGLSAGTLLAPVAVRGLIFAWIRGPGSSARIHKWAGVLRGGECVASAFGAAWGSRWVNEVNGTAAGLWVQWSPLLILGAAALVASLITGSAAVFWLHRASIDSPAPSPRSRLPLLRATEEGGTSVWQVWRGAPRVLERTAYWTILVGCHTLYLTYWQVDVPPSTATHVGYLDNGYILAVTYMAGAVASFASAVVARWTPGATDFTLVLAPACMATCLMVLPVRYALPISHAIFEFASVACGARISACLPENQRLIQFALNILGNTLISTILQSFISALPKYPHIQDKVVSIGLAVAALGYAVSCVVRRPEPRQSSPVNELIN